MICVGTPTGRNDCRAAGRSGCRSPVGSNMRCPMSPVRRLWPVLALFIAIGSAVSAQTTETVDPVTAALRAGNFGQAVERSQAALVRAPNDVRLWTLNGMALAGL